MSKMQQQLNDVKQRMKQLKSCVPCAQYHPFMPCTKCLCEVSTVCKLARMALALASSAFAGHVLTLGPCIFFFATGCSRSSLVRVSTWKKKTEHGWCNSKAGEVSSLVNACIVRRPKSLLLHVVRQHLEHTRHALRLARHMQAQMFVVSRDAVHCGVEGCSARLRESLRGRAGMQDACARSRPLALVPTPHQGPPPTL